MERFRELLARAAEEEEKLNGAGHEVAQQTQHRSHRKVQPEQAAQRERRKSGGSDTHLRRQRKHSQDRGSREGGNSKL